VERLYESVIAGGGQVHLMLTVFIMVEPDI